MFCKKCGHENEDDGMYCENCGANLSSTNSSSSSTSSGLGKTNKILIVAVVVLILGIGVVAGTLLISKAPVANNTSNTSNITNNTAVNVSETVTNTSTPKSENTATKTSKNSNFDLTGYTLTDVRSGGDYQTCQYCGHKTLIRTVYEYYNNAGDRKMMGEDYCTNCKRTYRDYWQNGHWDWDKD